MIYNETTYNTQWKTRKLDSLGVFARGKSKHRPRNDSKLFDGGGYPLVQTGEVKGANLFIDEHSAEYNEFGLSQSKLWNKGTLCITIAANIAETGILAYPMCFPDSVVGFNAYPSETSEIFMHYIFTYIRQSIQNSVVGSIQDNINLEYLQNLDFKIPDKKYQDKIVDVLYSIDKRIDIADRLYKKLNEFIRTTYDYYFVQFEFPSEAGKPYSQSGGSKTYSKLLKREIPSNWNVVPLNERLTFERGVEVGKDKYSSTKQDGYVKFYRVSDMNSTCENYVDARLLDNKLACPEDICVSFDGTVGKVDFGLTGGYSSGIRKISDNQNEMNNAVIYSIFISDYAQFVINKFATGSNILHSSESINNLFIPYDREVFLQLQKIITPAFDRMLKIRKEKEKLIRVRDWILPLLMNGQVTVD